MAEDNARINIRVSRNFKLEIKKAIANAGIEFAQDGYLMIMEKGLAQLKKEAKK